MTQPKPETIMSNIKEIEITGEIPFNATEHHDACKFLGQLNGPTIGLRIEYTGTAKARPNRYGGQTAYYNFCISGQEAVAHGWLKNLMQALVNCGASITSARSRDIENRQSMANLEIPKPAEHPEFVCELRFTVQDSSQPFERHQLQAWLKEALIVDLNMEEAGMFQANVDDDLDPACVSAGAALNTLSPA
jgi:hypothetical protein